MPAQKSSPVPRGRKRCTDLLQLLLRLFERSSQLPDYDTTRSIVCRGLDLLIDVEEQFGHIIVPVEIDD